MINLMRDCMDLYCVDLARMEYMLLAQYTPSKNFLLHRQCSPAGQCLQRVDVYNTLKYMLRIHVGATSHISQTLSAICDGHIQITT